MAILVNGVAVKRATTRVALDYLGCGRTKFYEAIGALGVEPTRRGNKSLWEVADVDRVDVWLNAQPSRHFDRAA